MRLNFRVFLCSLLLLAGCAPALDNQESDGAAGRNPPAQLAPPSQQLHVIRDDTGGNIWQYIAERERLRRWGGPVELRGYIASAAVIFTTLPNACLATNSHYGFHRPTTKGVNVPVATDLAAGVAVDVIGRFLRGGIREKWRSEWSKVPNKEIHRISAAEYVRLDPQTRLCPG